MVRNLRRHVSCCPSGGAPVPSKRRRLSAFTKILLSVGLICGLFVAAGYYVLTTVDPLDSTPDPEPGCRLDLSEGQYEMTIDQTENAATVGGVAFSLNMPRQAVTVAYATVWQESTFYNVEYGDRDSLGLFQQRPSQEWGEPEEILDPVQSSRSFYYALADIEGWRELPVHEAAQQVQRSADGWAYDQHEDLSERMSEALVGDLGPMVTCWYDDEGLAELQQAEPDPEGAREELARVFGADSKELPLIEAPQTGDLGWAMALWSVVHAEQYGLTTVAYDGHRWTASDGVEGAEDWTDTEGAEDGLVLR